MVTAVKTNGFLDVDVEFKPVLIDLVLDEIIGSHKDWARNREENFKEMAQAREMTKEYTLKWFEEIQSIGELVDPMTIQRVQVECIVPAFAGCLMGLTGKVRIF